MSRRSYELIELIRRKQSMSSAIVTKIDADYAFYAGADLGTALKLAKVDVLLRAGLFPHGMIPIIKLYRVYLNQMRKAFFASVGCTEITKLGFIQGDTREVVDAGK